MLELLFDTEIIMDHLRGIDGPRKYLEQRRENQDELCISVITIAEIFAKKPLEDTETKTRINEFLSFFKIIEVDSGIARQAGALIRHYELDYWESLLIATSIERQYHFVTLKTQLYKDIHQLKCFKPYVKKLF